MNIDNQEWYVQCYHLDKDLWVDLIQEPLTYAAARLHMKRSIFLKVMRIVHYTDKQF
jgi:hypothetical protein